MLVPGIAVAQVIAQLHSGRDVLAERDELPDNGGLRIVEGSRPETLDDAKLDSHVPLYGELIVGNRRRDGIALGQYARLVGRHDRVPVGWLHESSDRRQRRR